MPYVHHFDTFYQLFVLYLSQKHLQETINEIRRVNPTTTMETLIPDFKGRKEDIQTIIDVAPEIVSHNMETVERLTKKVRIQAKYRRSLDTLRILKEAATN